MYTGNRAVMSIVLTIAMLAGASGYAAEWKIDPAHSNVQFTVRHLISKVTGEFNKFEGTIHFDEKKPTESKVIAKVDATSIDTNNEKRDAHLRGEDFFHTEKHPTLELVSKKITRAGKNKYKMLADLTMRGVTKPVTFDVEYVGSMQGAQGPVAGFTATAKVNRKDFGINWNKTLDTGGVVLGDEVTINLNLEAVPATKAQ